MGSRGHADACVIDCPAAARPSLFDLVESPDAGAESSLTEEQREAIALAQAGDWSKADAMELAYLNDTSRGDTIRPWSHNPELESEDYDGYVAIRIDRGGAPNGQIAVIWAASEDCENCDGDGTLQAVGKIESVTVDCPRCLASGDITSDTECVSTDIDGRILE